jgi:predicted metal-dependent hydrolase
MIVTLAGIPLELVRKDIKNLHLAVYPPDGRVRLSAPNDVDDETLVLFVSSKVPWIRRKQRAISELHYQGPRELLDRESHYLLGNRYLLRAVELTPPHRFAFVEVSAKKRITVHVTNPRCIEQKKTALDRFYRRELQRVLKELVPLWEQRMGVMSSAWRIRSMKTKWGSCNTSTKSMLFNLQLAQQPVECIEYIVVHELAHLRERTHGPRFVAVLDTYLPSWKRLKEKLKDIPTTVSLN